jgi:hypothetical protein
MPIRGTCCTSPGSTGLPSSIWSGRSRSTRHSRPRVTGLPGARSAREARRVS